jgi:hypothetical protein
MVFIPLVLLREQIALKRAKATVDARFARKIYFQSQAVLEEATGEPCWGERGYVLFLCGISAVLGVASAYSALVGHNWVAVAVVIAALFGAIHLESLAIRRLAPLLITLLTGLVAALIMIQPAWPKLLIDSLFVYFLSFAYAARVTRLMMMRNDRAYRAMYPALRITFPNTP